MMLLMKKIKLTKGKYALVDDEDYDYLNQWKWMVGGKGSRGKTYYAIRWERGWSKYSNKPRKIIQMANVVMNCPKGFVIDHINRDGLDNRKQGLKIVTQKQNNNNRRVWGKSKFFGVYPEIEKRPNKVYTCWRVQIYSGKNRIFVGLYKTEIEAARAYDEKARELFGKSARLNFPK